MHDKTPSQSAKHPIQVLQFAYLFFMFATSLSFSPFSHPTSTAITLTLSILEALRAKGCFDDFCIPQRIPAECSHLPFITFCPIIDRPTACIWPIGLIMKLYLTSILMANKE
jgi:hypothetical protein